MNLNVFCFLYEAFLMNFYGEFDYLHRFFLGNLIFIDFVSISS
jgi:hypothetical protein